MQKFISAIEVFPHLTKIHMDILADDLIDEIVDVALLSQIENEHTNQVTNFIQETVVAFIDNWPSLLFFQLVQTHKTIDKEIVKLIVAW